MKQLRTRFSAKVTLQWSITVIVFVTMYCSMMSAQVSSEISTSSFSGGVVLDYAMATTGVQNDPIVAAQISGLPGSGGGICGYTRSIIAVGTSASTTGPIVNIVPTTVLAALAVLTGKVTMNYASYVAKNVDQVSIAYPPNPCTPNMGAGSAAGKVDFSEFSVARALDAASPSLFQQATAGGPSPFQTLVTQFNVPYPFEPSTGAACTGVSTQFDVDPSGNLLMDVSQSNAPLVGATLIVSLSSAIGTSQVQAMTNANGVAEFNGTGNAVPLNSATITGVDLEYPSTTNLPLTCVLLN